MTIQPSKGYNAYYDKNKRRDDKDGNERSRKRFKSEAPLRQQLRNSTPSNPDHRRRIRALQGLPPDDDDELEEHYTPPSSTHKEPHNDKQGNRTALDEATGDSEKRNSRSAVPDLGDILNSFKVPEGPRVFKSEPIDVDLWDSMLAPTPKLKRKQKRDRQDNAKQTVPPVREVSSDIPEFPDGQDARGKHAAVESAQVASRDVVDLTEEDDRREGSSSRAPVSQASTHVPTPHLLRPLTAVQMQTMDQTDLPQNILQQAIDIYRRENIALPITTRNWAQLKNFVTQHPVALISPQLCLAAQAHAFNAASVPPTPRLSHASTTNNADVARLYQPHSAADGIVDSNNLDGERAIFEEPQMKVEPEDAVQLNRRGEADVKQPPAVSANLADLSNMSSYRLPDGTSRATARSLETSSAQTNGTDTARAQIRSLMRPIDLMPDILPPDAPAGHPRLVKLWDPVLLSLPADQHDHLTIQDTVVSILAKYNLKTKSAVVAFLDVKKVNHFFFLFKARENSLHSWSIEREEDVITVSPNLTRCFCLRGACLCGSIDPRPPFIIHRQSRLLTHLQIGIERPTRAPNLNTTDQSRPSSGQYDLTIQYRILPFPPPLPALKSNVSRTSIRPSPDYITTADLDRHLAAHNTTATQYPDRWLLINTSIFPSSPDLPNFLYHTPPTRGADSHEIYTHPEQTPQLPSAHLSMFARYMANTSFSTNVMDAEIQVAFGRKVRYDAVLGRVRALWDYALKGARTQKAKRERGEYNRPQAQQKKLVGASGESSGNNGSGNGLNSGYRLGHAHTQIPGHGMSASYLARSLDGEDRKDTTLIDGLDEFVVEDGAVREQEFGDGTRDEDGEKMRKMVKKERMRREGNGSGSEYSDGSE